MSTAPSADHNLLFGVMAMQMNFLDRDALVAGMFEWVRDKQKPLGQILLERHHLTAAQVRALDALIVLHLNAHGDDPRRSLRALSTVSAVGSVLSDIDDPDVQASVQGLTTEADGAGRSAPVPAAVRDGVRYRVLRPHARGGLGEVFVAEDVELHREVALKEIQAAQADSATSRARFVLEAQITGGLEHPGIVPVYGLGVHPDGRPYYAMRFIRGVSLHKAIEQFHGAEKPGRDSGERGLAFRQLLRRFIDMCNAVAYAHSRGVLHRDLKPANVMLGPFGETLVVDWGLAKAGVEPPGSEDATCDPALRPAAAGDLAATRAGSTLGTPPFMSPEQAAGRTAELGPASDIYSLGASLYLLLTGKKPYDGADTEAIKAKVKLGRFTPPRQVKPDTPAALDATCRKAMAFESGDRYATALALAADMEHWLADEPATAYRDRWPVRTARWARRHRTGVVAAVVLLASAVVALSASTALVWREKRKTEEQKGIAVRNYRVARNLSLNGVDLIAAAEAEFAADPQKDKARREILKTSAQAFREYLAEQPDDPAMRTRSAQVFRLTANIHRLAYETAAADSLYRDTIDLYEGLAKQFPDDRSHRQNLSHSLRDRATNLTYLGRLREANESVGRAIAISETLRAEDPADGPALRWLLALALQNRAANEYSRGLYDESYETAKRAVDLFNGLLKEPLGNLIPYAQLLRAAAFNVMAVAEREAGRPDAALPLHREAIAPATELLNKLPAGITPNDVRHFLARFRLEQCRTLAKLPNPARLKVIETNVGGTITEWDRMAKSYPHDPMYRDALGLAYQFRGQFRADQNRLDEARADFEKSRLLFEERITETPQMPGAGGDLGRTYLGLGRLSRRAGELSGAAAWFAKSVVALDKAVEQSPDHAHDKRSRDEARAEAAK